ncbi:MAG: ribonuclease domain-containing protein [bacterium]|nr:ribonuclease domain-containing protein [bacterium]
MKQLLHKTLSLLLSLLLVLGLAAPLAGCTAEDALDLLTAVVESLPEASEAPAASEAPDAAEIPVPVQTDAPADTPVPAAPEETQAPAAPTYGEPYTDPYDVADYLHAYGELPPNFITKNEAKALGWDSAEGNLWDVAPGKSIGGDRFGNRERLLPEASGRTWYECDVNYAGGYRGAERVLYSSDGLIYYTDDHYESFTPLYEFED